MGVTLNYWRADNMWAAEGRPDGNLGQESVTLEAGQKRVFITDWKYEKQRNDGTNYYGSHARRLQNAGSKPIDVKLTSVDSIAAAVKQTLTGGTYGFIRLKPGATIDVKGDIQEVLVPKV